MINKNSTSFAHWYIEEYNNGWQCKKSGGSMQENPHSAVHSLASFTAWKTGFMECPEK
jgi:hypothetical protein